MNYTSFSGSFDGRKRKYESDDDPIVTSTRSFKRKVRKRPPEVDNSELPGLVGESPLEMPALEDFGTDGLDPTRFAWASKAAILATKNALRGETPRPPRKAAPPSVPDPADPDWNNEDRMNPNSRSRLRKRAPKSKRYVNPEDDHDVQFANDDHITQSVEPGDFSNFPVPLEIREMVYRNLLRSDKPIAVYDGWKKVYKHGNTRQTGPAFTDRPSLYINILGVNKWIYPEAARILYSENTFLYRLRDPPAISSPPLNLDALISYDSTPSTNGSLDDEDPNDPDYQDDNPPNNTRRARSMRKKKDFSGPCINVSKFLHLYRHIIVEAEHNRSGDDTLKSMAEAIQIFNNPPPIDKDSIPLYPKVTAPEPSKKERNNRRKATQRVRREETTTPMVAKPNIMTLVIKIRPSRAPNGFTFVNFFDKKSPIPQAIRDLRPQQLYVKVMMVQLSQQRNGVSLPISFRHQRIVCLTASGEPDTWARDREMIFRRKRKAIESLRKLEDLSKNVRKFCNKYFVEHEGINEEGDEFDFDWDEIDDDESDFDVQHATQTEDQVELQAEEGPEASQLEVQDDITADLQTDQPEELGIQNGEAIEPQTEATQEAVQREILETMQNEVQESVQDRAQEAALDGSQDVVRGKNEDVALTGAQEGALDESHEAAQDQATAQEAMQDTEQSEAQDDFVMELQTDFFVAEGHPAEPELIV